MWCNYLKVLINGKKGGMTVRKNKEMKGGKKAGEVKRREERS